MRTTYRLSDADYEQLVAASRPNPIGVNKVWRDIGRRMGFDWTTVGDAPGATDNRTFTAEPLPEAHDG